MRKRIFWFLALVVVVVPVLAAACGGGSKTVDVKVDNISHNSGDSLGPRIVVDKSGSPHVVWFDLTPGFNNIFYASKSTGGSWTDPINIYSHNNNSRSPSLAIDGQGTLHAAWFDFGPGNWEIFYSQKPVGGVWSAPANASNNIEDSRSPSIVVDSQGVVHAAWEQSNPSSGDIFYASRNQDGTWSTGVNISNNTGASLSPSISVDKKGDIHVAWYDNTSGEEEIYYAEKPAGGDWSVPVNISSNSGKSEYPVVAVDSQNTVLVTWQDNSPGNWDIFFAPKSAAGSWTAPDYISRNDNDSGFPTIVVDSRDNEYLAWNDNSPNVSQALYEIFYVARNPGGNWSGPVNISGTAVKSGDPSVAVDSQGVLHAAWSEYINSNWDVVYASRQGIPVK